jgi:hypothetical protein
LRQAADRHQAKTSGDPKEVAAVVAKALEARRPRFRYQVGFFAKLDYFLRGKMPTRLVRRGTTRYLAFRWRDNRSFGHLRASKTSFASLMRQAR